MLAETSKLLEKKAFSWRLTYCVRGESIAIMSGIMAVYMAGTGEVDESFIHPGRERERETGMEVLITRLECCECCFLSTSWLLHSPTHSSYEYTYKTCTGLGCKCRKVWGSVDAGPGPDVRVGFK